MTARLKPGNPHDDGGGLVARDGRLPDPRRTGLCRNWLGLAGRQIMSKICCNSCGHVTDVTGCDMCLSDYNYLSMMDLRRMTRAEMSQTPKSETF